MKKLYLFAILGVITASCSSDDSSTTPTPPDNNTSTAEFLPLASGNYWVYNVQDSQQQGRDSLYISGNLTAGGNNYKKFTTLNSPLGLFSNTIYNDGIRKDGDRLLLNGVFELAFADQFALNIPVTDFIIFKENASANQQLGVTSGVLVQPYNGYDITFEYTLSTQFKQSLATYTVNTQAYNNVKQIQTVLNLKITAPVNLGGNSFTATIMLPQNVVVANQYYAAGVGVVHTSSDISYQLQDLSLVGASLPIPQSATEHQEEKLDNYQVN